jgi:hypothetical protein
MSDRRSVIGLSLALIFLGISLSPLLIPKDVFLPPFQAVKVIGESVLNGPTPSPSAAPAILAIAPKARIAAIARLFPPAKAKGVQQKSPAPLAGSPSPPPISRPVERPSWIRFIWKAEDDTGAIVYYFRDSKAGSLQRLIPSPAEGADGVLSDSGDYLRIRLNEQLYDVRR